MREAIVEVLSMVLALPAPQVSKDGFGPSTCSSWDSLKHLQIALALEDRFACTFDPAEVPRLVDVPAIEGVLREKGAA
jgi:acyl carrier protein